MWSFLGIVLSSALTIVSLALTRRSTLEGGRLDQRSETYGLLRWSAELALSSTDRQSRAGVQILDALVGSVLIDPADLDLMSAVFRSVARTMLP
jgi:hypothetical protein